MSNTSDQGPGHEKSDFSLEQVTEDLDAQLSALADLPTYFSRRLEETLNRMNEIPMDIVLKVAALRCAIQKLAVQTAIPGAPLSSSEMVEPAIDLFGDVPEQVNNLCRWFRAKMAKADTFSVLERECQRRLFITKFEAQMNALIGKSFGPDGNMSIIKDFREALKVTRCRVQCGCSSIGFPYCQDAKNSQTLEGAFQIILYFKGGQTFHGGPSKFPGYKIVPAPLSLQNERPQPHQSHARKHPK